jgi:hypothetical protein
MKRASRMSGAREKQPIATIARTSDATSTAPGHAADKQEAATRSEKHNARDTDEKEAGASQRSDKHSARSERCNTANCDIKVR